MKILLNGPLEELEIIEKNTMVMRLEDYGVKKVLKPSDILIMQEFSKKLHISPEIKKYIVEIVTATRKPEEYSLKTGKYIQWGGSPRACINLSIAAKATALMNGRDFVVPDDIKNVAHEVMRHRIILNYEGRAEGISTDEIITEILDTIPVP